MKKRTLFKSVFCVMLALAMCFASTSVFACATTVSETDSINNITYIELNTVYGEENGEAYIEFTVPETYDTRSMTSHTENIYCLGGYERDGSSFTSQDNRISVSASGENCGATVTIQIKVKGALNQYYDVSGGSKSLICDGVSHHIFEGFVIEAGKTYRFSYYLPASVSATPKITLAAVMYSV